jgi:hypothetical protein
LVCSSAAEKCSAWRWFRIINSSVHDDCAGPLFMTKETTEDNRALQEVSSFDVALQKKTLSDRLP